MSGFSPEWLALREPVDHRSRDARLARRIAARFGFSPRVEVVDLGCGTGSNLRATFALLGPEQSWTLVDYDPRLIDAARSRLSAWADEAKADGKGLRLVKSGKRLDVGFRQADLVKELDAALGTRPELVTASALFDLCSADFIARFARAVAARGAAFYTVLTYNGVQTWTPPHPADADMAAAFHAHQRSDKGFGAAAGPYAPQALAEGFRRAGYRIEEGDSPWLLGGADTALVHDLAHGFAGAVAETGKVTAGSIASWRAIARTGAVVGHTDTLALPTGG